MLPDSPDLALRYPEGWHGGTKPAGRIRGMGAMYARGQCSGKAAAPLTPTPANLATNRPKHPSRARALRLAGGGGGRDGAEERTLSPDRLGKFYLTDFCLLFRALAVSTVPLRAPFGAASNSKPPHALTCAANCCSQSAQRQHLIKPQGDYACCSRKLGPDRTPVKKSY